MSAPMESARSVYLGGLALLLIIVAAAVICGVLR